MSYLIGTKNADWLSVNDGFGPTPPFPSPDPSTIIGKAGDDILSGGVADDLIKGGRGNDLLYGMLGDDILRGGRGADFLSGYDGDNTLTGGRGADQFVFVAGFGFSTVTDFGRGHDKIIISSTDPNVDVVYDKISHEIAVDGVTVGVIHGDTVHNNDIIIVG